MSGCAAPCCGRDDTLRHLLCVDAVTCSSLAERTLVKAESLEWLKLTAMPQASCRRAELSERERFDPLTSRFERERAL